MLEEVAGAGLEVRIPLKDIELGPRKRLRLLKRSASRVAGVSHDLQYLGRAKGLLDAALVGR